jgi:hypothetical protein
MTGLAGKAVSAAKRPTAVRAAASEKLEAAARSGAEGIHLQAEPLASGRRKKAAGPETTKPAGGGA